MTYCRKATEQNKHRKQQTVGRGRLQQLSGTEKLLEHHGHRLLPQVRAVRLHLPGIPELRLH